MRLPTVHFGWVEANERDVIRFAAPLPPFASQCYLLLSKPDEDPFLWLQSVDEPALALLVLPYDLATADPVPELAVARRRELGLGEQEAPEVYVVVSLGGEAAEATANLLAPLYVCRTTMRGRQLIGDGDLTLTRTPLC